MNSLLSTALTGLMTLAPTSGDPGSPITEVQLTAGGREGELVLASGRAARGLLLIGTPRPGAATLEGGSLSLWSSALGEARVRPFAVGDAGSTSVFLSRFERTQGTVVQTVLLGRDGELVRVIGTRGLPSDVVLPPSPQAPAVSPGTMLVGKPGGSPSILSPCPTAGATDLPDGQYRDENCDGIDGTIGRALFVDWASGAMVASGAMSDPLANVQVAIDLASVTPGIDHVYVSTGTYTGELELRDGVSVWGGFDAADGWSRASDHTTTFTNSTAGAEGLVGVRAEFFNSRTVLGDVTVTTSTAPAGMHNYGVKAYQAVDLRLQRVLVQAGAGGVGANGANGSGVTTRYSGGAGGAGGEASYGSGKTGKGGTGPGGNGGAGGSGTNNGKTGKDGGDGSSVGSGAPGTNLCSVSGSVLVCSNNGSKGPDGNRGGGGGGGGGSGAGLIKDGGNGGTGGAGGGGGRGGFPGTGGGSSIAVFAEDSIVRVVGCDLASGNGGLAGSGGGGSIGQSGLNGKSGENVSGVSKGGTGGDGGTGSNGGSAGGGGGGHSFVIVRGPGATTMVLNSVLTPGAGGAGGAPNGPTGESLATKQL